MSLCLQEHDYIGLSSEAAAAGVASMENDKPIKKDLNLKATELRLGLPGSESPERDGGGVLKGCLNSSSVSVSGAKRGFSDTINVGSSKWVFSGSEVDLSKNGVGLFSPRSGGGDANSSVLLPPTPNAVKEAVPPPKPLMEKNPQISHSSTAQGAAPATKAQVVGWPPIRSFRKNTMAVNLPKNEDDTDTKLGSGCLYVKVSMDGAPYLRKVDLKIYSSYMELSSALEKMFSCFTIGQCGSHGVPMRDGLTESRLMDLLHGSEYVLTYEDKDGDWMLVGDVPWDMFTGSCKRMRIMKSSDAIGLAPRAMEKCRNRN